MIFIPLILALLGLGVNSEECYICHNGDSENILTLVSVFGTAEEGLQEAVKFQHDKCGTGVTEGLKMQACDKGCVIAKHENSGAVIAGCVRRGIASRGVATFTNDDQKYQMGVCSKRGCNRSFGTALSNKEDPLPTTTTTAAPPAEAKKEEEKKEEKKEETKEEKKEEEKKEEEKKTENETPKAEEPKPSSAATAVLSLSAAILLLTSLL